MNQSLNNKFDLGEATRQVITLKKEMGKSVIALGKWLTTVRENIPRGEWMDWLKYEVKIPYVQVWRFMRIAQEIDYPTLERVGYAKMAEILELPASKFRDELIELAPSLRRDDIKTIKADNNPEVDSSDIVQAVTPAFIDADTALDANATLLDALLRIKIAELSEEYKDLLKTQLRKTPNRLKEFIIGIWRYWQRIPMLRDGE